MALDQSPTPPSAAETMAAAAAQTLFDGAMTSFVGHLMSGQPHKVSAAAAELHELLDGLLDAKQASIRALRRSLGL